MVDTAQQAIVTASNYSVRQFSPNSWGGLIGDTLGFLWPSRTDLLPRWGSLECDIALRVLYYTQHNSLVGGATEAWIEKFLSIPYEISGGRNLTYTWQDLFFESDFGEGYDVLCSKGLVDYLTLNRGWFMEIVSYGDPDTPIKEGAKILGLNHLDALRIYFTGNLEHPYLYQSEWDGGLHKMHTDRVIHISRQPSPDTRMFNIGKSALYDSVTISNAQILLGRPQNEMLNDLPPPGIVIFNNVKAEEVETAMKQFEYERIRDGQNVYRAPLSLSSKDPSQPATVTFVPLSTVPEGFNYREYMDTHVNMLALCYGLDPQDIWPLSGVALGTGAQSKVLAAKTGVKGPGYLSTYLTRKWNKVLPRQLEWKYKAQNAEQDKETADLAAVWITNANSAPLSAQEKRQLLVNQVAAIADVIADEQGIARVNDEDVETPQQEQIVADDTTELNTPSDGTQDTTTNDQTNTQTAPPEDQKPPAVTKAIDDTTSEFISEIQAALTDGVNKVVTKASTAARIRGAISRYGKLAYQDGLEDGGVSDDLSEEDRLAISDMAVHDTQYVSDIVNEIYSETGMSGTPETRAPMWAKTLSEFYQTGLASAGANGMYEWVVGDTDHCRDCERMNGQVHRIKDYIRKGITPQSSDLECGGYRCQCQLIRTTQRASGNWL